MGIGGAAGVRLAPGFFENDRHAKYLRPFQPHYARNQQRPASCALDFSHYLKEGKFELADLTSSYFFKFAPEIYGRVTGGYLEEMFAGVGDDFSRPFGKRWAVGVDL
jgi:hypothetical protein